MRPAEIAERYFACILVRDLDGLMELYEDDATFVLPNGREFEGKAAIQEMHQNVFASSPPSPNPMAIVAGKSEIAVEIEARLPDGTVRNTANFYHLSDNGKIARLSVYMRTG